MAKRDPGCSKHFIVDQSWSEDSQDDINQTDSNESFMTKSLIEDHLLYLERLEKEGKNVPDSCIQCFKEALYQYSKRKKTRNACQERSSTSIDSKRSRKNVDGKRDSCYETSSDKKRNRDDDQCQTDNNQDDLLISDTDRIKIKSQFTDNEECDCSEKRKIIIKKINCKHSDKKCFIVKQKKCKHELAKEKEKSNLQSDRITDDKTGCGCKEKKENAVSDKPRKSMSNDEQSSSDETFAKINKDCKEIYSGKKVSSPRSKPVVCEHCCSLIFKNQNLDGEDSENDEDDKTKCEKILRSYSELNGKNSFIADECTNSQKEIKKSRTSKSQISYKQNICEATDDENYDADTESSNENVWIIFMKPDKQKQSQIEEKQKTCSKICNGAESFDESRSKNTFDKTVSFSSRSCDAILTNDNECDCVKGKQVSSEDQFCTEDRVSNKHNCKHEERFDYNIRQARNQDSSENQLYTEDRVSKKYDCKHEERFDYNKRQARNQDYSENQFCIEDRVSKKHNCKHEERFDYNKRQARNQDFSENQFCTEDRVSKKYDCKHEERFDNNKRQSRNQDSSEDQVYRAHNVSKKYDCRNKEKFDYLKECDCLKDGKEVSSEDQACSPADNVNKKYNYKCEERFDYNKRQARNEDSSEDQFCTAGNERKKQNFKHEERFDYNKRQAKELDCSKRKQIPSRDQFSTAYDTTKKHTCNHKEISEYNKYQAEELDNDSLCSCSQVKTTSMCVNVTENNQQSPDNFEINDECESVMKSREKIWGDNIPPELIIKNTSYARRHANCCADENVNEYVSKYVCPKNRNARVEPCQTMNAKKNVLYDKCIDHKKEVNDDLFNQNDYNICDHEFHDRKGMSKVKSHASGLSPEKETERPDEFGTPKIICCNCQLSDSTENLKSPSSKMLLQRKDKFDMKKCIKENRTVTDGLNYFTILQTCDEEKPIRKRNSDDTKRREKKTSSKEKMLCEKCDMCNTIICTNEKKKTPSKSEDKLKERKNRQSKTNDQESKTNDQESKTNDQESKTNDQETKTNDQESKTNKNENIIYVVHKFETLNKTKEEDGTSDKKNEARSSENKSNPSESKEPEKIKSCSCPDSKKDLEEDAMTDSKKDAKNEETDTSLKKTDSDSLEDTQKNNSPKPNTLTITIIPQSQNDKEVKVEEVKKKSQKEEESAKKEAAKSSDDAGETEQKSRRCKQYQSANCNCSERCKCTKQKKLSTSKKSDSNAQPQRRVNRGSRTRGSKIPNETEEENPDEMLCNCNPCKCSEINENESSIKLIIENNK